MWHKEPKLKFGEMKLRFLLLQFGKLGSIILKSLGLYQFMYIDIGGILDSDVKLHLGCVLMNTLLYFGIVALV